MKSAFSFKPEALKVSTTLSAMLSSLSRVSMTCIAAMEIRASSLVFSEVKAYLFSVYIDFWVCSCDMCSTFLCVFCAIITRGLGLFLRFVV